MKPLSGLLLIVSLLANLSHAIEAKNHLVSVTRTTLQFSIPPSVKQVLGSGICINRDCSVVATAYHCQLLAGRGNLGVADGKTDKILSLARETDGNKGSISAQNKTLSYNLANDISFLYTKKAIPHKSATTYSYVAQVGQTVHVAGFYKRNFEMREAHILGVNLPLVLGRAVLNDNLVVDVPLDAGRSGSAVLDQQGNLLGMVTLSGVIHFKSGDVKASIALPVKTIANALVKLDPTIGSTVFTDIPAEADRLPELPSQVYEEMGLPEDDSPIVPDLSVIPVDIPTAVNMLQEQSAIASKRLMNFVARQCLVQGTKKPLCHELSLADGRQTFREITKNGKLGAPLDSLPPQKHGVWTLSDWADTLFRIADNQWVFQGVTGNHYLFTFRSSAQDGRCEFREYPIFGGDRPTWGGSVACFEQVVTDKDFNVLSVFTEMTPPDSCVTQVIQTAIEYGWVALDGLSEPVLLPVSERVTAKIAGHAKLWYAKVSWTDYRRFRSEHRIHL